MKINHKIFLVLLLFFISFTITLFAYWQYAQTSLQKIEGEQNREFSATLNEVLQLTSKGMETINRDYTYWDDMVIFLYQPSKDWEDNNLIDAMNTNGYDYTIVIDSKKKTLLLCSK